jgi:2'-5' RNA ligase
VRLFVALDIPEEVRGAIGKLASKLGPACRSAKWTKIENVHVTLKFIGEVSREKCEEIETALLHLHFPATIAMIFRGLGFFPDERRPRVLWAGVEATDQLPKLATAVESALEPLGVPRERREFSPHLTLARIESTRELPQLLTAIASVSPAEFGRSVAREFHLYQSVTKPGGAEYTQLATYPLQEDE